MQRDLPVMLQNPSSRRALTCALFTVVLAAGCSRQLSQSLAPESSVRSIGLVRAPAPNAAENQLPQATIVSPTPSSFAPSIVTAPLHIEWTGTDGDGHLREYRFRVFGRHNPDFPQVVDFVAFLTSEPQQVLSFYEARKFEGWDRLAVRKDTQPSADYSALARGSERYAFVVVAIDNRGAHDATLSTNQNVLQFVVAPRSESPSLTFAGPFGEATVASEATSTVTVSMTVGEPFEVSWHATPLPGMVIKGYRSTFELGGTSQPTSLANTSTVISPPAGAILIQPLYVEVEFDDGKRALYTLRFGLP